MRKELLAVSACIGLPIVSACSGATPTGPISSLSLQQPAAVTHGAPSRSRMLPEAKRHALLYVSEYGGGVVDVFTYPRGTFVGELSGFNSAQGVCADKKGDVFIDNANINHGQPSIIEFAHGGTTPIQNLSDPDQDPYGCSVDPKTGNLAVSNESGKLAIYQGAQGSPSYLFDGNLALMLWCGYDNNGDLFVDGLNNKGLPELDEVPSGKLEFIKINLSQNIGFPGNIQWDGTHVTLGDALYHGADTSAIYQLQILGRSGIIVGTTVLKQSEEVFGSWIAGTRVVGPEDGRSFDQVDYWAYPAGGTPTKSLKKGGSGFFDGPFGAAVSRAT